jgi:hypothetical protein
MSSVSLWRIEQDLDRCSDVVPRGGVDGDFETVLLCEREHVEPKVVGWFAAVESFDIARVNVHGVDGGFTVIEPECGVVGCWRAVWRRRQVVIRSDDVVWAFIVAADEPTDTGSLSRLVEIVRFNESIALVAAHNMGEDVPNTQNAHVLVVRIVVDVVADGLFKLFVFVGFFELS